MGVLTRKNRLCAALLALAIGLLLPAHATAQQPKALYEQKIKAGLVYNFLKYTAWPGDAAPAAKGGMNLCLFGGEALDGYLAPLKGRTAQQSVISVSRISAVSEVARCNVVFIPAAQEDMLPELLAYAKDKPVLTVSDIGSFARRGGMVELTTDNQHVGMAINKGAVERSGLHIEDRLLKLAKVVSGGAP